MAKVSQCDRVVAEGRLRKAVRFWEAAEMVREFADDEAEKLVVAARERFSGG